MSRNQPQINKTMIESKLKPLLIQEKMETSPKTSSEKPPETSPEPSLPIQEKMEPLPKKTQEQKEDELLNETSLSILLSLLNAEKKSENNSKTKPLPEISQDSNSTLAPEPEQKENIEEIVASAILAASNQ